MDKVKLQNYIKIFRITCKKWEKYIKRKNILFDWYWPNWHEQHISGGYTNLIIRRLSNKNTNEKTELLQLDNSDNSICDIEQSLNPIIFKETIESLDVDTKYKITTIVRENGNTHFTENLRNLDIRDYFKEAEGSNKIIFAKQYIEIIKTKEDINIYIPEWINTIKEYFIGIKKSNKKWLKVQYYQLLNKYNKVNYSEQLHSTIQNNFKILKLSTQISEELTKLQFTGVEK